MIKCETVKDFTLNDFNKLSNIKRKLMTQEGKLFVGDTFECDEKMAKYLNGDNDKKAVVVKIVEIMPKKTTKK